MQWRRWTLGLVITLMLIDLWAPGAEANGPRPAPGAPAPPTTGRP